MSATVIDVILAGLIRLDTLAVLASVAGACCLHLWRVRNHRADGTEQWIGDAFSCGTLFVIPIVMFEYVVGDHWGLGDYVKSNIYVVLLSLANCLRATLSGIWASVRTR